MQLTRIWVVYGGTDSGEMNVAVGFATVKAAAEQRLVYPLEFDNHQGTDWMLSNNDLEDLNTQGYVWL